MNARRAFLAVTLIAVGLAPSTASAQKDRFIDALIAFRTALGGTYGDEGPQIEAALDRMASSLAAWDREAAVAETELRSGLPNAPPEDRLRRRVALASLMLDRDRWADALHDLDAAVAEHPQRAFAYQARGRVRDKAGDAVGAARDFQRAWELDRSDAVKAYLLVTRGLAAGVLDDPGPPLGALLAAQRAATGPPPRGFMEIGLLRDRAQWPVFAPAAYAEGFAIVAAGRYGEAVASFRAAVTRDPLLTDPAAKMTELAQGIASLRRGQYGTGITYIEAAVARSPTSAEAHRVLGTAYHLADRPAESVAHLTTAIRLAPTDERPRLALARALLARERREEAGRALREAIAALPASAEARWSLAQLHIESDRSLEAIAELEMLSTFPMLAGRGQVGWLLAGLYRRHQDFDAMSRALTERARLDLNDPVAHKELGFAHLLRGRRQRALAELLVTALFAPEDLETLARIGQIHVDEGRYADAETVLRRVVARAPEMARARFALGTTLVRLGRTEEGLAELGAFRRLNVSRWEEERRKIEFETLLRNAERSAGDGRLDEAIASLERAAAIVVDAPRVYELLASVYGRLGRIDDQQRARAAYERLAGTRAVEP
jgi:tetratricopeptide (TPR) repeat protein